MPDMSVTIRPTGEAYRLARKVIEVLGEQCPGAECRKMDARAGGCADFEPHVTLQYVYAVADGDVPRVADALELLFRDAEPFPIVFGKLDTFRSVAGVHVGLEPCTELVALYQRTKAALIALGQRTYPYDPETWQPHMTLSCRHWTPDAVARIRAAYPRLEGSFVVERIQINELRQDGRWVALRDVPLRPRD